MNIQLDDYADEDDDMARIMATTRVVAMVGLSPNEARPSWGVARYLQAMGMRVIPVNAGHAGKTILGEKTYASLADIPTSEHVDMVDIFRRPEAVSDIVDQALQHLPKLRTIWCQLGVRDDRAAEKARGHSITVVQDRCPKIEFARLA
ncbi:CoA-binding protein [Paracoccus sp. 11-3]|uniref:CoA-binding protein n=1 Tax=Paracoccus amoyensis TaxID=2760093 RepID=A0A926GI79_9RHOB|nr:CoA-binding protein [Paracoccus amoyensis]MBC9247739.1 CoA-binding protein [Paracoccus amoyensis]